MSQITYLYKHKSSQMKDNFQGQISRSNIPQNYSDYIQLTRLFFVLDCNCDKLNVLHFNTMMIMIVYPIKYAHGLLCLVLINFHL